MASRNPQRLAFIEALKAIACQLIVLHHLAFYGPMSDRASQLAPDLVAWLSNHGRLAVQAFLVIAGFLAARAVAPQGRLLARAPSVLVGKRYLRLVVPYVVVLTLAIASAAIARGWMQHDSIPAPPTSAQVLAHALLLHDLLGFEALSAGLWYVAIDFQLFALFLAVLWLARWVEGQTRAPGWLGPALVGGLALASLFFFNRDPGWDRWALYFFGAYAMGAAAFWISSRPNAARWLAFLVLSVVAALTLEFRSRIAAALSVAVLLVLASRTGVLTQWPRHRGVALLGRISYAVFLVHFPVCLLVNAAFVRFLPANAGFHAFGMLAAWVASVGVGALFYRLVESRVDAVTTRARELVRSARAWAPPVVRLRSAAARGVD